VECRAELPDPGIASEDTEGHRADIRSTEKGRQNFLSDKLLEKQLVKFHQGHSLGFINGKS
jgi:hypothetical protein